MPDRENYELNVTVEQDRRHWRPRRSEIDRRLATYTFRLEWWRDSFSPDRRKFMRSADKSSGRRYDNRRQANEPDRRGQCQSIFQ